jgi:hypothetical protein
VNEPTGPLADPGLVIGDDDCVTAKVPCQVKPYLDIAVGLEGGATRVNHPAYGRAAHSDFPCKLVLRRIRARRHLVLDFCPHFRRMALVSFGLAPCLELDIVPIGNPPDRRITHIAEPARHPRRVGILFQRGKNSFFLLRCNWRRAGHWSFKKS